MDAVDDEAVDAEIPGRNTVPDRDTERLDAGVINPQLIKVSNRQSRRSMCIESFDLRLDVFDREPEVPEQLFSLDNVVLTPHIASNTEETIQAMGECVIDNVRSWFAGKGAVTPVS